VIIDLWVFSGVKTLTGTMTNVRARQWIHWIYWGINMSFIAALLLATFTFSRAIGPTRLINYVMAILILLLIPKLIFILFLFVEDIYRIFRAAMVWVRSFTSETTPDYFEGRRKFISQAAAAVATVPFFSILYGITKGKYNYTVHNVTLKFPSLPGKFHGFTIAQISDIHSGSFDNREAVKKGVRMVNEQKPDMIVFTGDLVNNRAKEMEQWIDVFKVLDAPYGKFSILGNHDYGDYIEWPTPQDKIANNMRLMQVHSEIGFRLLLNENVSIKKDDQQISLLGVENWGLKPFPQYGSLPDAMRNVDPDAFKILLSHDPSHFDEQVISYRDPIHLTLSGHTHGMQFGVEIAGFKWSPVKYRYPKWAGLYEEAGRYLYVNRGFGFLGFPGRVGIWPEITMIRLEKG
jgi:uncharacterized protein